MKLKKIKKLLAVTLSATMFVSVLGGCSSTSSDSSTSTSETTEEAVATEFSLWMPIHSTTATHYSTLNDHPGVALVAEATGIDVTFEHAPVDQEVTQFNLLTAKPDSLPDAIFYYVDANYPGGLMAGIEDGVFLDITELVEENAPNFMAYLEENEDLRRDAYNDDGVLVNFGCVLSDEWMAGRCFTGPQVNKTYLDAVGLDVPVTIADWEEMLIAFRDELGIIPLSFGCAGEFVSNGLNEAFASAYGTTAGARFMDVDGVATFGPLEDGYYEWLELFSEWYAEGLIDPDFLSLTTSDARANFNTGEYGASIAHVSAITQLPLITEELGNAMEVVAAPYPVLNEGDTINFKHHMDNISEEQLVITSNAEDPIAIIEYFDYLYSDEGVSLTYWGTEGTDYDDAENTYYIAEDGSKAETALVESNQDAQVQYILRDLNLVYENESQIYQYRNEEQIAAFAEWDLATSDWAMPNSISLTSEESTSYTKIMTDITTYVNEMTAKYIMGIESLDTYDTFIETINAMGIEEATAIQQAALDRYYAR